MVLPPDQQQRLGSIRRQIRATGHRWTPAKDTIVETLLADGGHLSVLQLHHAVLALHPGVDRSTIHRVLLVLADEHVVHALDQVGEARYGLADHPHHHAICSRCRRSTEIPAPTIQPLLSAAGTETGFRFDTGSVTLAGQCADCSETPDH